MLIEAPAAGRVAEHASQPVALDPRELIEIRLEYRNRGGPAAMTLQYGTGPGAKQPVPTTALYPADGLSSFAPVEQSYRRLHKAALILTGFGVTDGQLEWLSGDPPFVNLDALPMEAATAADAAALFLRWRQLAGLYALRKKLPRSNVDLFDVFKAGAMPEAIERLVLATGWDRAAVEAFIGPEGFAIDAVSALRPSPEQGDEPTLLRLARAMEIQRRVGVAPATLNVWASATPDADGAAAIVQAVKARYDETRWLEVAGQLNDPLRAERRDALVSYLLPRMRDLGVRNRNQLFEYFLIDVDMNPCMLTSRIRQAIGAVQTFFQRCLDEPRAEGSAARDRRQRLEVDEELPRVGGEPEGLPLSRELDRAGAARRQVAALPGARAHDPAAGDQERQRRSGIRRLPRGARRNRAARRARRLVRGTRARTGWSRQAPKVLHIPPAPRSEWDEGTYHVFARTFNAPYVWYYRRLERGRTWTAWEKIEADIEGEHLVPVVFNRRMHLFWTMFREVSKTLPELKRETKGPPPSLGKDWEIQLAYSVYDRGRWSRKRMSTGGVIDQGTIVHDGCDQERGRQAATRCRRPTTRFARR